MEKSTPGDLEGVADLDILILTYTGEVAVFSLDDDENKVKISFYLSF